MTDIRLCLKNVSANAEKWQIRMLLHEFGVTAGPIQFTKKDQDGYTPQFQTVFVEMESAAWLWNLGPQSLTNKNFYLILIEYLCLSSH